MRVGELGLLPVFAGMAVIVWLLTQSMALTVPFLITGLLFIPTNHLVLTSCVGFPVALMVARWFPLEWGDVQLFVSDAFLVVGIAKMLSHDALRGRVVHTHSVCLALVALSVLQFLTAVWGNNTPLALTSWARMNAQYAAFVFLARTSNKSERQFLDWFYYGLIYVPVSIVFEFGMDWVGHPIGAEWFGNFEGTHRYVGIVGDTAQASMLTLLLLFVALYSAKSRTAKTSYGKLHVTVAVLCVFAVFLTGTRGTVVCLLVGLGAFFMLEQRLRPTRATILVGVPIAAITAGAIVLFEPLSTVLTRFGEEDAWATRSEPMRHALSVVTESLWTGVGFGRGWDVLRETLPPNYEYGVGAFNQYLHVTMETGVLGLAGFLVFGLALMQALRQAPRCTGVAFAARRATALWVVLLFTVYLSEVWLVPGSRLSAIMLGASGYLVDGVRPETHV